MERLLAASANTAVLDNSNQTALHRACIKGHSRAVDTFLGQAACAQPCLQELLGLAVKHGHPTVFQALQVPAVCS